MTLRLPALLREPPLDPSGDEGRRLLREELAKLPYGDRRSLMERIQDWIAEQIDKAALSGGSLVGQIAIVLLAAAVVALVIFVVSRTTNSRRVKTGTAEAGAVLEETHVSAAEYRKRARTAAGREDHSEALLNWFRAIARSADERALLGDAPGRTSHELVANISPFFPDEAAALRTAGDTFDAVRYGGRRASQTQATSMRDLDDRLQHARPHHGEHDDGPALTAPGRWAP